MKIFSKTILALFISIQCLAGGLGLSALMPTFYEIEMQKSKNYVHVDGDKQPADLNYELSGSMIQFGWNLSSEYFFQTGIGLFTNTQYHHTSVNPEDVYTSFRLSYLSFPLSVGRTFNMWSNLSIYGSFGIVMNIKNGVKAKRVNINNRPYIGTPGTNYSDHHLSPIFRLGIGYGGKYQLKIGYLLYGRWLSTDRTIDNIMLGFDSDGDLKNKLVNSLEISLGLKRK